MGKQDSNDITGMLPISILSELGKLMQLVASYAISGKEESRELTHETFNTLITITGHASRSHSDRAMVMINVEQTRPGHGLCQCSLKFWAKDLYHTHSEEGRQPNWKATIYGQQQFNTIPNPTTMQENQIRTK